MAIVGSGQVVLVVDDEPLILEMVASALEDAGFGTLRFSDGDAVITHLDGGGAHDVAAIVTDVGLGGSASGWEIGRRARELRAGIPIVYMSGDSAAEWTAEGVPQSVMIAKPFAPAQIVVAIAQLINATSGDPLN